VLLGGEAGHTSEQDASLKAVLEAIGRELALRVVAHISVHDKITVQFDRLSLTEALQRLHTNYASVMEGQKSAPSAACSPTAEVSGSAW
jgi:hypothetical protein